MANRIPRNAALFHITLLQDTGSNKAGTKATVYRHVYDGWQMLTESGEKFMVLTSYLRMSEVVQIDDFMLFPEEITEAQFQDVKKITAKHYSRLYNADDIETDNESMIYSSLFDWYLSKHAEAVRKYNAHCFDFLTSDREGAAFMLALYELQNAPTETENTEGKEDTTTAETEPQRATETAQKTADDTTTAGSDTDHTEAAQTEEKTIRTGARLYSRPQSSRWRTTPPATPKAQRAPQRPREENAHGKPHRTPTEPRKHIDPYRDTPRRIKGHTEPHREPRRVSCATLPPRPPADGRQKKVIFWPVWDQRKF